MPEGLFAFQEMVFVSPRGQIIVRQIQYLDVARWSFVQSHGQGESIGNIVVEIGFGDPVAVVPG